MRKHIVIVAATMAAAITLVACSEEETLKQNSQPLIGFNIVVDNAKSTRSVAPITTANFTKFDVWAYKVDKEDANPVMGVNASKGYQISKSSTYGVQTQNMGVWGYSDKHQETFWPSDGTQQMNFYAVAPTIINNTVPNLTLNITKAEHAFTYTASESLVSGSINDGNIITSHNEQRDIIVAGNKVKLTDINVAKDPSVIWMSVPLTFRHALSQVNFDATLEANCPELKITIYSITLCNIYRTGTCTIDAETNTVSWGDYPAKERYAYTVMTGQAGTGITLYSKDGKKLHDPTTQEEIGDITTVVPLSNGTSTTNSDNLMLIPQTITPWNPVDAETRKPDEQSGAYLKIRCDITQNGTNILQEGDKYIYTPFSNIARDEYTDLTTTDWDSKLNAGKVYTYHLNFGVGRNKNGQLNWGIQFSVSIGDSWITGNVQNPEL